MNLKQLLAKAKNPAKEIASKFTEPRGVLVRTEEGRGAVLLPEGIEAGAKPFKVGADTPEQAGTTYQKMMAVGDPKAETVSTAMEVRADKKARAADDITQELPAKTGLAEKASSALTLAQRKLWQKAADAVGVKSDINSSEATLQNLAEAAAEKLGIPENSAAGNAAKAAAVAAGEVFGDPLGLVPVGKIAKAVKSAPGVSKALEAGSKALSPEVAAQIDKIRRKISLAELASVLRPKSAARSAAGELAAKGAPVVKATHIVKSRP